MAGRQSKSGVAMKLAYTGGRSLLFRLLALFVAVLSSSSAWSAAYDAPLPMELGTDPDLCAYVPCRDVFPSADSFSVRKGRPAYTEAYRGTGTSRELLGYVFLSTDIVDIPAYSGKPVVTLIGMDVKGVITGAKVLRHSEPILLLGIPESELTKFIKQYVGKFVGDRIEIGRSNADKGYIGLDAITGATVTVISQNQVMLRSGIEIAKQVGILQPVVRPQAHFAGAAQSLSWQQLVEEGSVQRLTVATAELGMPPSEQPYIDIWFGLLDAPGIGMSVLGKSGYENLMSRLKPGEHAIFLISSGLESFKGSGFVRGGIFDRVQVSQDGDTFTFRDLDYLNLYGVQAAGAPRYKESAIFILRGGESFSAAFPWNLVFLANKFDHVTGARVFTSFDREIWMPAHYLDGGRPVIVLPDPVWLRIWKDRAVQIAAFVALLAFTAVIYAMREKLARRSSRKDKRWVMWPKYFAWAVSISFVGFYALAQPSITQVLTWFHSLLFQWKWELFLSDPFIFVFWIFIIVTVFVWGRGLFCGWLCPFGSLSELLYKAGGWVGLKRFQFQLPKPLHDRLKWGKYIAFWSLLGVSFYSMGLAEKLAEIEPFKTTFLVGLFKRSWPYTLFAAGLLGLSIFIERPFCKYLCPLGGALAIPSTFRWYGLKRKAECNTCNACAVGCGSLAIDAGGRIDQRECLLCLDCMVFYYDDHACPPLAKERKARSRAGIAMTPIGDDGYFIPIKPVSS